MTLPINYLTLTAALFPVFIFLMLLIFKWGAAEAAPVSALLTIFTSFTVFRTSAMMIAVEGAKGVWNAVIMVLFLLAAAIFYRILRRAGEVAPLDGKKEDYHKTDLAKRMEAEQEDDKIIIKMPEAGTAFAVMAALAAAFLLIAPLGNALSFIAPGFDFPEDATGYNYVNAAAAHYAPLSGLFKAAVLLYIVDITGIIILGIRGQLRHGGLSRILIKSAELALPFGIGLTGLMIMLSLMNGTGQIYVISMGAVNEISVEMIALLFVIAAPLSLQIAERKREKEAEALEKAAKAASASKAADASKDAKRFKHKLKFYETKEGALSIAYMVILAAFVIMMVGVWGSDETFTLDGFAAIITAMLYCPMRTFIFEKAKLLI
ncbi:MAG: hypothetical protein Q4E57_06900 [Eubacteriales bacterium]|nr:hypothetical protein [Eubacteriales bacterium]